MGCVPILRHLTTRVEQIPMDMASIRKQIMENDGDLFRRRMMGESDSFISLQEYIASGESIERLEELRLTLRVLCDFLEKHQLVLTRLYDPAIGITNSFQLKLSQLTESGKDLVLSTAPSWMSALDRGTPLTDTSRLEKALTKQS